MDKPDERCITDNYGFVQDENGNKNWFKGFLEIKRRHKFQRSKKKKKTPETKNEVLAVITLKNDQLEQFLCMSGSTRYEKQRNWPLPENKR